ncbi:DNA-directed RNA polymerase I subunit RPA43 [Pantherophis guttatus]|uniref:DNA-directed RNA polymerase subunit n=1 Tax=Pantherophis guttatus TaxID=94885 RepID=A0A6P9AJ58_PANGU|nr:DNA-directed RNA polymerase I subunit RPA43 [Pantherophis guttatus]
MAEMEAGSTLGATEVEAAVVTSTAAPNAPTPLPTCVELPSFEAARALAENRYSCLVVVPHRRHIALPPRFLNRKRTGICAQLDAELRRYSDSFQGVPVAYDDIKITKELGDIIDDIGAIHLDIEATFVVFQPKPGKKLVGIINKVAPSHIGCLVHECFNASIPKPDHISIEEWKNFGFQIGIRLVFKVLHFDSDAAGVFCIRGKLCKNSLGEEMLKEKCKKKYEKHCDVHIGSEEMEVDISSVGLEDREMHNGDDEDDHGIYDKPETENGQDGAEVGMHASDSSGYHSDHGKSKKKKRKLFEEENGHTGLLKSKAKKKRKE